MANSTDLEQLAAENARETERLLAELKEARKPNYSQPLQAIRKFENQKSITGVKSVFDRPGQFFKAVRDCANGNFVQHEKMNKYVQTMQKALPTGMNETQGADGGYLVPPEYAQQILMRAYQNDLLTRTTLFPMTSNSLKIPAINETSRADGSRFGGVQAYWRAEASTVTTTKPNFKQISLDLESLMLLVQVTQELLDDAQGVALETFIDLVASSEMSFKIGDSIVNGNGVMQPLGILNSPAKVAVVKESSQPAATLVAQNILKMWSRLHVSCRPNSVWLVDQTVEPALSTMGIGVSTAGGQLTYMPPGGMSAAPYGTLMGRPVIPIEFGKQLGTEGDIILVDLSTYLTGTKQGLQTASSMHVRFDTAEMTYRFMLRMDGKPWWLAPLTPKSGGPTQSCIVTLETRA